ncbi:hypothetical protein BSKO_11898 [Bryopsis sp. KO-2023]|nr:hypothetical protein BSKO_11898 [Bryopsis sp. KO-2023]
MATKTMMLCALVVLAVGANGQGMGGLGGVLGGGGGGGGVVSRITNIHRAKLCRKLALIGQGNNSFCGGGAKGRTKEPMEEPTPEMPEKIVYVKEVLPKATGHMVWEPKATAYEISPKATADMVWEPKATAPAVHVAPKKVVPVKIVHLEKKPMPAPTKTIVLKTYTSTGGVASGHTKVVTSP